MPAALVRTQVPDDLGRERDDALNIDHHDRGIHGNGLRTLGLGHGDQLLRPLLIAGLLPREESLIKHFIFVTFFPKLFEYIDALLSKFTAWTLAFKGPLRLT